MTVTGHRALDESCIRLSDGVHTESREHFAITSAS